MTVNNLMQDLYQSVSVSSTRRNNEFLEKLESTVNKDRLTQRLQEISREPSIDEIKKKMGSSSAEECLKAAYSSLELIECLWS